MTRTARLALCAAAVLASLPLAAQEGAGRVTVEVRAGAEPVADASVRSGAVARRTGADGRAVLVLPAGPRTVSASKLGFAPDSATVTVRAGADTTLTLTLEERAEELEALVVTSTRTGQRLEDEPTRVEVLPREEVEEKMLMTPGDIAMLLNETSGLRVQTTAPSLGGASVRVQGLRGRYTQVLSDGLPLYGGQSGALSLLQIPPMDLGQVEVIKGAASALYGASALGGVVNLVSRRPGDDRELLLNQTTLGGSDAVGWASGPLAGRWGYTLLASAHRQGRNDRDGDGWADLPGYRRAVLRPRLFLDGGGGGSLFVTVGAMGEDREGGTVGGATTPDGTRFPEELSTRRLDAGAVARFPLPGGRLAALRASAMGQRHRHRFGEVRERDAHATGFAEAAVSGTDGGHTWVLGGAFQHERYAARDVEGFDYAYSIPSLFAQDEYAAADWLTLAASARADWHSDYGAFLSPRVNLLLRPGEWTAR
ncbi:MAG TPA: TonB-dependent receptor, partial [Longimicrobiaceae bacterium]|nr:TonB-dependent receptor [Longimicrobiaceae bacterium]